MNIFRKQNVNDVISDSNKSNKKRTLKTLDLTLMSIGAVIGTGVLVLPGVVAATLAGPGEILSFIIAGIASIFVVLCYSEFASSIPSSGGSYTYVYVSLGEIFGYIVGVSVIFGYVLALGLVSNGWSDYLNSFLEIFNISLPIAISKIPSNGGIINLPAVLITLFIMYILSLGGNESKLFNNIIVILKVLVIVIFVLVGVFYIDIDNLTPFFPMGISGVISGASVLFLAYTGFDVTASAAEETINPQKTLPRALILSIIACAIIYCIVSFVLTGMVPYKDLNQGDALAYALVQVGHHFASSILSIGAILGILAIIFAIGFGNSRILSALSSDGLIPKVFSKQNKHAVPNVSLWTIGIIGAILSGFVQLDSLANASTLALLFVYLMVSLSVIVFRKTNPDFKRGFRTPFVPLIPILAILSCGFLMISLPISTWIYFIIFIILAIIFYFTYSIKNSNLNKK
ncbi:APC family permease [Clostridium thermobutyricum]|uniref:APC family permease n=1 Tax=Clostridium thermobutyricum TaxID=29372 RepID=UPI0018AA982B|nr:amino acid permease [Clostridium thermobutyricum]